MADRDFGELRVYPGNYDDFMIASTAVRERLLSDNAKKKTQITELQHFVSHDREFISSLATHIIEITPDGVVNFKGSYDEYLVSQGIEPMARLRAAG